MGLGRARTQAVSVQGPKRMLRSLFGCCGVTDGALALTDEPIDPKQKLRSMLRSSIAVAKFKRSLDSCGNVDCIARKQQCSYDLRDLDAKWPGHALIAYEFIARLEPLEVHAELDAAEAVDDDAADEEFVPAAEDEVDEENMESTQDEVDECIDEATELLEDLPEDPDEDLVDELNAENEEDPADADFVVADDDDEEDELIGEDEDEDLEAELEEEEEESEDEEYDEDEEEVVLEVVA